ncbi:LysR family transcriptional regulator [Micromonospora sp. NPDC050980]|uniref:LysR family transcriptional regulator n=1 Tax=Micromonospora sp. NPDC050980 TaxID=3155161 RepID=UPI0034024C7C
MELEVRHLRCFLAIVDSGSVNRAARLLGLPASAVTQQVQRIERHLDVRLFDRSPVGMALTAAGRELVEPARRAVEAMRQAQDVTARRGRHLRWASEYLPVLFGSAEKTPEAVTVELVDVALETALRRLTEGSLDVVQGFDTPAAPLRFPAGLTVATVARERLAVLVGPGHRLWDHPVISLAQLADEVWVSQATPHRFTTGLRVMCGQAGFEPRIRYATGDRIAANELVSLGDVVALGSPFTRATHKLRAVPLIEDHRVRLFVTWRRHALPEEMTIQLVNGPRAWYAAMARRLRPDDWQAYGRPATDDPRDVIACG